MSHPSTSIQNHELFDGRIAWCWGRIDGLPAFRWGWAPDGLATRSQLQTRRLRRSRGQDPSRPMTPRWRASLTMAYLAHCTCRACGREVDGYLPTAVWRCQLCR